MTVRAPHLRLAVVCSLVALTALIVVAQRPPVLGAQDEEVVTIWLDTSTGTEAPNCIVENAVEVFKRQNETVEIDVTLPPDSWNAIRTAVAEGAGPDIVITPGPSLALDMARAGHLLPLDQYGETYGWSDRFTPWTRELGIAEGRLYSLPSEIETLVLFYNATLFEERGWTPPTTMDDLVTLAQEIDAAGIIPFAHTNAGWRLANAWFVSEFFSKVAGPDLVNQALRGEIDWTAPAFIEAVDLLTEMQQNGWFMGGLDGYYTTPPDTAFERFASGDAAMKIEGTWAIADIDAAFAEGDSRWEWVPVPSVSGEVIFDVGIGSTFSINRNAQSPDAAAEYLDFLFSPEIQATLAVECGIVPGPVPLEPDALAGLDPRFAEIIEAVDNASRSGDYGYTTWTFWPPQSSVYLYEEIERVWAGEITAEEYLQGLQAQFDEEAEAGDTLPVPER